jgi:hypothetical protein
MLNVNFTHWFRYYIHRDQNDLTKFCCDGFMQYLNNANRFLILVQPTM